MARQDGDGGPGRGEPRGGGVFIMAGLFAGIIGGFLVGQVTIGTLTGFAAGVLAAVLVAWRDKRR